MVCAAICSIAAYYLRTLHLHYTDNSAGLCPAEGYGLVCGSHQEAKIDRFFRLH